MIFKCNKFNFAYLKKNYYTSKWCVWKNNKYINKLKERNCQKNKFEKMFICKDNFFSSKRLLIIKGLNAIFNSHI